MGAPRLRLPALLRNARLRHGSPPEQRPAIALAVATQFADLLDEPLAWSVDVLPTPRSLGHSLVFVAAVVAVVALVDRRRGGPAYAPAVAIGYSSHLLGVVALWTADGRPSLRPGR